MVLTPDAADFLRLLEEDAKAVAGWSYEQLREAARAAAMAADDRIGLDDVRDVDADGVPCRLYRPRIGAPVALYVHGGGWVLHDLETHDAFCRELAHRTGWALLAVDFRRSPEHPYPAPLDDVETAARWLREEGRGLRLATEMVAGIGDSAGANLLAGLTVRAPGLLDALVLMYPPVDAAAAFADEDNAALGRQRHAGVLGRLCARLRRGESGGQPAAGRPHRLPADARDHRRARHPPRPG